MGKVAMYITDSEDDTCSSVENIKKKKRKNLSIFKYARSNLKKKKNQAASKSEPSESDFGSRCRSRSSVKVASNSTRKLVGILKHTERESSEEDEDYAPQPMYRSQDRCLVGQVPRPPGSKPGRGGGVAILVRKNVSDMPHQSSTSSTKRRKSTKRLSRKQSY